MVKHLVSRRIHILAPARVECGFQTLKRRGVSGKPPLSLLGRRQSELVEEHVAELLSGVEIEWAPDRLVHLVLDARHILAQLP